MLSATMISKFLKDQKRTLCSNAFRQTKVALAVIALLSSTSSGMYSDEKMAEESQEIPPAETLKVHSKPLTDKLAERIFGPNGPSDEIRQLIDEEWTWNWKHELEAREEEQQEKNELKRMADELAKDKETAIEEGNHPRCEPSKWQEKGLNALQDNTPLPAQLHGSEASEKADYYLRRYIGNVLTLQKKLLESDDFKAELFAKGIRPLTNGDLIPPAFKTTPADGFKSAMTYNVLSQALNGANGGFHVNFAHEEYLEYCESLCNNNKFNCEDLPPLAKKGKFDYFGGTEKSKFYQILDAKVTNSKTRTLFVRNPLAELIWGERIRGLPNNKLFEAKEYFKDQNGNKLVFQRANGFDLIMYDILKNDPTFVCLQEVDHPEFFRREMKACGYNGGVFFPKAQSASSKMMGEDDGLLVFWKNGYTRKETWAVPMPKPGAKKYVTRCQPFEIPVDKFDARDANPEQYEYFESNKGLKQIGLIVVLEDEHTNDEFCLVTNHLKSGSISGDLYEKGFQLIYFANKIKELCKDKPIIQLGDMNTSMETYTPKMDYYDAYEFNCDCGNIRTQLETKCVCAPKKEGDEKN